MVSDQCSSFVNEVGCKGPHKAMGVVVQPPPLAIVVEAKSDRQTRRYPTRRRFAVTGNSPHLKVQLGCTQLEEVKCIDGISMLNFSVSSNARVTRSSKRKLCALENVDSPSMPPTNMGIVTSGLLPTCLPCAECENGHGKNNVIVTADKVKGILQSYRTIYHRLFQEDERQKISGRLDLMALKQFKDSVKCVCTAQRYLGSIPGVEVGDRFKFRAELSITGLHRNLQAAIESIKHDETNVALSIVSYGRCYSDIIHGSDILLYSGSRGCKEDQRLEGGNLALKNSIYTQTPVRVIYGFEEQGLIDFKASKSKKGPLAYIYDGLYLVEKYWSEEGSNGFSIFKFQLRRMIKQPQVDIKECTLSKVSQQQSATKGSSVQKGVCIKDISQGKEKKPLRVVNTIDDELPMSFTYTMEIIYPSWTQLIQYSKGCVCIGGCSDSIKCACVVKNGGEIPFNNDGCIMHARPLVYECGPSCGCPPTCQNRVSQHGIQYKVEIFKTKSMGWGVRSLSYIPSGSFICEYTGEMLQEAEANARETDDYLFDIGKNYNDESLWEGLPNHMLDMQKHTTTTTIDTEEEEGFTIDAACFGNVARFINHNCTPNLYAQNVLFDHQDKSMPHVMLFASENISPLEELTYHYNYAIDRVQCPDGTIKKKDCYCGSIECTGRLY